MMRAARTFTFLSAVAATMAFSTSTMAQQIGLGGNCSDEGRPSVQCVADKMTVKAGDSVRLTASGTSPKNEPLTYMWRVENGHIFGSGANVRFDTTGLTPGRYDVVLMGRGLSCGVARCVSTIEVAGCPDLSINADSTSVVAGQTVELSTAGYAGGATYHWTASAGSVTESGATAHLDTKGLPSGPITVRVAAVDTDCNAEQSLTVNVTKPEPLPPSVLLFNSNDSRLDNADKAQLDDSALRAGQDPSSRVVVIAGADAGGRSGIAQRRANRTRDYLVNEKGIDPSRVEVRTNGTTPNSVQVVIVPQGADVPQD